MNVAALVSGGKDSIYAAYLAKEMEHELKYLVVVESKNPESYMYHVPNIELTKKIAKAMQIPIRYVVTEGEKEEELKELKEVLKELKGNVSGVVSGALASNYQRERIEKICNNLNLESLTPLWHVDEDDYMEDLLKNNFVVVITSVSAGGLDKSWLGKKINEKTLKELKRIRDKHRIHLAGEGGEYETLVLDCPLYNKKLELDNYRVFWEKISGRLKINKVILKCKNK
ncbi:MAG: diphthine--ammonia ligase [Candidatus Aenigmatarchaeota archaeon]